MINKTFLSAAIALALSHSVSAQSQSEKMQDKKAKQATELSEIQVTATPLRAHAAELIEPVEILLGRELDRQKASTIGETVANQAGVQTSFFGAGVGRPIIRGFEGARVQVLSGGLGSLDASNVSADHAVTIEPFLADQIEILKGPSALLFGSGAIGGIVNIVDGRIADAPIDGVAGRAEARHGSGSNENTIMARIDFGLDQFVLHADAFKRDADDYDIPGPDKKLENSAADASGGALGISYFGDFGSAGISISRYETLYGIPSAEEEEGERARSTSIEKIFRSRKNFNLAKHEGEELVRIDMEQDRIDARLILDEPFDGIENINFKLGKNDYQHVELEGEEIGTSFSNEAIEARLEATHALIGPWRGSVGVQYGRRDFAAIGEEALAPPSLTKDLGIFIVEHAKWERVHIELGARANRVDIDSVTGESESRSANSLSFGARYSIIEPLALTLNIDRAARAPSAEELFSNGPHIATGGFEIGDSNLKTETANQFELGLQWQNERVSSRIAMYQNNFDRFIYLSDTDETEDGLPIRQWTQSDAKFVGLEAEIDLALASNASGNWDIHWFGDLVNANLESGENLPRIAPRRIGFNLEWSKNQFNANLGATRYSAQDRVAPLETASDGYTLLNAGVSYQIETSHSTWELFVLGKNLNNQLAFSHTSFLKDFAPLPGRSVTLGVRAAF